MKIAHAFVISALLASTASFADELAAALRTCNPAQVSRYLKELTDLPREVDGKALLSFCPGEPLITRALLARNAPVRPASFQLLSLPIWGGQDIKWLASLQLFGKRDLDLNARGKLGETAVFNLAGRELTGISVLQELLRRGADPNLASNSSDSPLQNAVRYDHLAAAQLLLAYGAQPAYVNKHGQTALDIALSWRPKPNPAMVELLIEYGADPNQRVRWPIKAGAQQPLLQQLVEARRYEAISLLLRLGADPLQKNSEQQTVFAVAQATADPMIVQAFAAAAGLRR